MERWSLNVLVTENDSTMTINITIEDELFESYLKERMSIYSTDLVCCVNYKYYFMKNYLMVIEPAIEDMLPIYKEVERAHINLNQPIELNIEALFKKSNRSRKLYKLQEQARTKLNKWLLSEYARFKKIESQMLTLHCL